MEQILDWSPKKAQVDNFYRVALEKGGSSGAPPEDRANDPSVSFMASILDLDGNELVGVCLNK